MRRAGVRGRARGRARARVRARARARGRARGRGRGRGRGRVQYACVSSSCVAATVSEHGSAGRRPQKVEKTYEAILKEGGAPGLPARTALAMHVSHSEVIQKRSSV